MRKFKNVSALYIILILTALFNGSCEKQAESNGKDFDDMVVIPAGIFKMGCRTGENNLPDDENCFADEYPYHEVSLKSFRIDKYEVTNEQFAVFINDIKNICMITETNTRYREWSCAYTDKYNPGIEEIGEEEWRVKPGYEKYPVSGVQWIGAKVYCEWAGKRLPSEAEWEYAARGDDGRLYPWGDEEPNCDYTVMRSDKSGCGTEFFWEVGSKEKDVSPFGVYDMAGNISEWVEDAWHGTYKGAPEDGTAWGDPENTEPYKVVRGGDYNAKYDVRSSLRKSGEYDGYNPKIKVIGFRCAADL